MCYVVRVYLRFSQREQNYGTFIIDEVFNLM